jgi:TRAP-type C4-dicarboxylate transport system permease small subunit
VVQTTLSIALMAIVAVYAVVLAIELWDQLMPTLNLSVGLFYAILAFSAMHSILHLLNGALAQSSLAESPANE